VTETHIKVAVDGIYVKQLL